LPSLAQHLLVPSPEAPHTSEPQQSPPEHVVRSFLQPVSGTHSPITQINPLQQSPSSVHDCERVLHAHTPASQSISPQQSRLVLQAPSRSTQQRGSVDRAMGRQDSPEQQRLASPSMPAVPHELPTSMHSSTVLHWKPRHSRPSRHSLLEMQNEPSPPPRHMPDTHCMKPQQSAEFVHGPPSPWQQRRPPRPTRHTEPLQHSWPGRMPPSTQESDGPRHVEQAPASQFNEPVHAPPAAPVRQHIWPSVPQSGGGITHMRIDASQSSPSSQTLRGRHG
jgi:hypothetical protein